MIKIGEICPLFFSPIKNEFQQDIDYIQRFHTDDNILVQALSDNEDDVVSFCLHDLISDTSSVVGHLTFRVNSTTVLHQVQLSGLKDSVYSLSVREETSDASYKSEPFTVCSDFLLLKETCLILYSNEDNNSPFDNIFWIDDIQQVFEFRVEGGFKPGGVSFKVDNEQFRNQSQEIVELYSVPYNTYTFTCGNASGIPYWIALFINNVLSLSYFVIGKERYVRSGNSVPEQTQISEDGQMFNMSVVLEKNTNEYFMLSQKSMQVSAEASSCVVRVRSNMGWSFVITEGETFINSKERNRGKGSRDIVFDISANNVDSPRTGKIKFTTEEGGETYLTINQKKADTLTLVPDTIQDIPKNGANYDIMINSSGNWTCVNTPLWAIPNIHTGEAGKTVVNIDVEMNESGAERSGVMTFKLDDADTVGTLVIQQEGEVLPLVITPNTIHGIPSSGGSYDVTIKATGNWTCSYNPTWARPDNGSGAAGETTIKLDIDANTGNERSDYLEFELDDTGYVVKLDVLQNAASPISGISLEPPFPSELLGNAYSGGEYEVVSENDWSASFAESIEMNPTTGGAGRTYVDFQVPANTDKPRVVALELVDEITGERYLFGCIQQAVTGASKEIVPSTEGFTNVPKAGGLRSTYIASLKDWIYDADLSVNANWLTVIQKSGVEGITEVSIMVSQNQTGLERLGEIWFATADGTDYSRIGVHQLG